jgi:hypothetical protein
MRCRRALIPTSVVAVAACSLLAAGCGGGAPGVASVASSRTATTTTPQNGAAAFARCMRSHGVLNFPDPNSSAVFDGIKIKQADRRAADSQVRAAQSECYHLIPNGIPVARETTRQERTRVADELSFARCMRSRGVTRFPDPTAPGQLSVAMVEAQGIDVHSPAVLHVVQACLPASHGALTPAKVREALNNARG